MDLNTWYSRATRSLSVGAVLLASVVGPATVSAAPDTCPGGKAPSIDRAFERLVEVIGASVVGSAVECDHKGEGLKDFAQRTANGVLVRQDDGTVRFDSTTGA